MDAAFDVQGSRSKNKSRGLRSKRLNVERSLIAAEGYIFFTYQLKTPPDVTDTSCPLTFQEARKIPANLRWKMLKSNFRTFLLLGLLMAAAAFSLSQSSAAQNPDNTDVNRGDRSQATADQQQIDRADRDLTDQIRRAIVGDKSLSTDAHNVKVIARNGQVTLKGPVRSESERRTVEAKAVEVAGQDRVINELVIKPSK